MPQIWLSYDELADERGCSASQAAEHSLGKGWARRRCSDGLTRVKLPEALVTDYMRSSVSRSAPEQQTDALVSQLKQLLINAAADRPPPRQSII